MRLTLPISTVLAALTGSAVVGTCASQADPYRWCAEYAGGRGGGTNCGFVTLEQCRATVSGIGGFCRENLFYDDVPFNAEPIRKRQARRR